MPTTSQGAHQGINPKLVNAAAGLAIITFLAILVLWALPLVSQNVSNGKAEEIAASNSEASAAEAMKKYAAAKLFNPVFMKEINYSQENLPDEDAMYREAAITAGENGPARLMTIAAKAKDGVHFYYKVAPTYKKSGGAYEFPRVYIVYKETATGDWKIE